MGIDWIWCAIRGKQYVNWPLQFTRLAGQKKYIDRCPLQAGSAFDTNVCNNNRICKCGLEQLD